MSSLILKAGLSLIIIFAVWFMLAVGITTVSWTSLLGVALFGWGFVLAVLMYDFIGPLDERLIGFGVVLMVIGLLITIMPFAPELFL